MTATTMKKIALAAIAVTLAGAPAMAKDWIEKVSIERAGIDVKPIEVRASSNGYTAMKTDNHSFSLRLYARATNGERIVAVKLAMYNGVDYFESDGANWNASLTGREVGSGSKRTLDREYTASIPASKIGWKGKSAVEACKALLAEKVSAGQSKSAVLAKTWDTEADVFFQLDAVAAHKNKAENGKWNAGNTEHQRGSGSYAVNVRCLAVPARVGG